VIDINHPHSEFIFKAATFTDKLKGYCQKYILETFEERKNTFLDMKIEALLLQEFSEIHFKENLNIILELINDLNIEIDKLESKSPEEIYNIINKLDWATGAAFI
jgi:hypothetical protein